MSVLANTSSRWRADPRRLADEAEIEHLLDVAVLVPPGAGELGRLDQMTVLAGQADRLTTGRLESRIRSAC